MVSIKQSEVELNHSSEQCSELFFKTLGLLFLNGPSEENVQLLTLGLENCRQCGLISQAEYEELSEQLDLPAPVSYTHLRFNFIKFEYLGTSH